MILIESLKDGVGNPFNATGLVRSFFRPSDDSTIYQGFIPANMMFARFLEATAPIMKKLGNQDALVERMTTLASTVRAAIAKHGIVHTAAFGSIYAFEVDGYLGQNISESRRFRAIDCIGRSGVADGFLPQSQWMMRTFQVFWQHPSSDIWMSTMRSTRTLVDSC